MRALLLLLLAFTPSARPQASPAADPNLTAIRRVLDKQAADWNRGDLDRFATGYKNSPDILFVGRFISRGYAAMLARYHVGYPTPAAMGRLSFTHVESVLLDIRFATATGNFHLERSPAGGGNADGIFSLVFEKTPEGWKIIRDHTTALPPATPPAPPAP